MSDALTLQGVAKTYGELRAVQSLDLSVPRGSVYGLLGPNGAGKTTTIRMIMDIIRPDRGTISLDGNPDPEHRRLQVAYLPEERGLYRKMKVREIILYFARLRGVAPAEARRRADGWLARMDLIPHAESKLEALSKGNQQKVQFVTTVLHEPRAVILDEPFSGLDPVNVELVKDILLEMKQKGTTILFSTHQMDTVEKLCDAICLIDRGRKVLDGPVARVRKEHGTDTVQLEYEGAAAFLRDRSLVARVDDSGQFAEIVPAPGVSPQAILAAAVREVSVRRFTVAEPSLHRIFLDTVRSLGRGA